MKNSVLMITLSLLGACTQFAIAQEKKIKPTLPDINFLLRTSVEVPQQKNEVASIKQNEARVEIKGELNPQIEYRVRYRLTRDSQHRVLDNSPGSLDIASATYKFGNAHKYELTVGKQAAAVGNWEFENNPTYEYQYSEHVNKQLNLFLLAAKFGVQVNSNNAFFVQVHNTLNDTFEEIYAQQNIQLDGYQSAKMPMGIYLGWRGDLADKAFQTYWTYNISQVAKGKTNHMVSLGNRYAIGKIEGYLDLSYQNAPIDYFGVATSSLPWTSFGAKSFATEVAYSTAALRVNYNFAPKWYLTAKVFIDHSRGNRSDGKGRVADFERNNLGILGGMEFKPFQNENFKLFGYYFNNAQKIKSFSNNQTNDYGLIAFGALYFVNAVK